MIDCSNADRYIDAFSHLLEVLVILLFIILYRPSSDRNARRLARKLHDAGEPLKEAVNKQKTGG